jgi:signal transduction histidine kinase/CheY-like chemotaxis protein
MDMSAKQDDRLRAAQTVALFHTAPAGVLGALVGGIVFGGVLLKLDYSSPSLVIAWMIVLSVDAASHLIILRLASRARGKGQSLQPFILPFDLVCLAEGLTWGIGSILLIGSGELQQQLLIMIIVVAIVGGSLTTFGSRLSSSYLFLFPTILPFTLWCFSRGDAAHIGLGLFGSIYLGAIAVLAYRSYTNVTEALRLRFENLDLVEDLQRRKEIAEQANLAKSRFLAAASHDLRQPVHALGMFVGALRGCKMDEEAGRLLGHVETSVTAMDSLFSSLLDISRLDAGVVQVRPQVFRIGSVIERVCRDYEVEAQGKGLRLVALPCAVIVRSDPILVERILRNLVSNAVRYTDRGRVIVGCRRGARLSIEIWDSGCGIQHDQQDRIFEEFYQLDNPERDRAKGLGLGLTIVRRLADLLECPLSLRSKPGQGSVFKISVPYAGAAAVNLPRAPTEPPAPAFGGGLILVVDDETAIQEAMRSLLTSWGHEVIVAGARDEALAQVPAASRAPDLIICDYRLRAEENGIEVIAQLRSHFAADVPALLITGDTAPDRLAEARASGLLILHKPVANAKLRAAIGNLMGKASPPAL